MQGRGPSDDERSGASNVAAQGTDSINSIVRNGSILRGIGVLLIIARHTLGRAYSTDDPLLRPVCILVSQLGCYAIPLFLVLSGFSLSLGAARRPRFRKYGHIVLTKILPAFTIWYFTYAILTAIKHPDRIGVLSFFSDYVRLANTGHLWFLVLLIQLYLLFPLLHGFYKRPVFGRFTILFVIAIVYFTEDLFQPGRPLTLASPYFSRLFSSNAVFFVLGFYLRDYAAVFTQYARKALVVVAVLLAAGAIQAYQITHVVSIPDSCDMKSVTAMASAMVMLTLLYLLSEWCYARGGRVSAFLTGYGLYSYGIYLAHVVPMAFSYSVLRLFFLADNDVVLLGNMIATMVLSKMFVKGLSKMPFSEYYV